MASRSSAGAGRVMTKAEQKELAALRESERAFRALANSIPQLAWMADATGWIFWYNDRWYDYTGTTLEEMQGWGWQRVHHPEHVDRVVARIRQAFETGEPWEDTFPLRSRTGEYRWFLSRALPITDDNGNVVRWFGTNTDVTEREQLLDRETERRRVAEALRENEERFRALAENATAAIFVIDEESRIEFVNPAVQRIFGYTVDEMLGTSLDRLMPPDQRPLHAAGVQRYLTTRHRNLRWEGVELPGLTKDGRIVPLEISFGEFVRRGRRYFTGIARDITERTRAEQALRESEARYRLLADMTPQNIWTTDPQGYHTYFSRRWYEYSGATSEESRGEGWLQFIDPNDRERTIARWQHSLDTGEPYDIEYRFRGSDGTYHWFLGQAMPLRNESGEITQWFGTATDISERKRLEAERERVIESRARLMRGFGHDVKNPLGAADGYLHLMTVSDTLTPKQQEWVLKVRRSIRAALNLIEDLLELARAEAGEIAIERGTTDLRDVIPDAADEYRAQAAAAGLVLTMEVPETLPVIDSDARRIRQVIGNLLSNAVKYTERGRIIVRVREVEGGKAPGPGCWIAVDVADTGHGIPEAQQPLVFQEFRRLQNSGDEKGAGIGLAISRRIAQMLGGDITVESAVGQGSTFTLWLRCLPSRPSGTLDRQGGVLGVR